MLSRLLPSKKLPLDRSLSVGVFAAIAHQGATFGEGDPRVRKHLDLYDRLRPQWDKEKKVTIKSVEDACLIQDAVEYYLETRDSDDPKLKPGPGSELVIELSEETPDFDDLNTQLVEYIAKESGYDA